MNKRLIEIAIALACILAYVLIKALAAYLSVDMGELGPLLKMVGEFALPGMAGALLFQRPSDADALKPAESE